MGYRMARKKILSERIYDPEETRKDILRAAQNEFSSHGFAGGKIDRIAAKTKRSKRMVYYYYSTKKMLYIAALEDAYMTMREAERRLDLESEDPRLAIKRLVEFSFDYHSANPNYVKMIMSENINGGRYLAESSIVSEMHRDIIKRIERVLNRGYDQDLFGQAVSPIEFHLTMTALCFFNVSNRATFSFIFGHNMTSAAARRERKQQIFLTLMARLDGRLDDIPTTFS